MVIISDLYLTITQMLANKVFNVSLSVSILIQLYLYRCCCRSRGEKRQSVAPLVTTVHCNSLTTVESTHTNTNNIKDFKEKLDDEQSEEPKQLSYKDITVKMDWFCLVAFLTFTVLMSIWFIIATAV